jgi:hypothetical protein
MVIPVCRLLLPLLNPSCFAAVGDGVRAADVVKESVRGSAGSHVLVMCVCMLDLLCLPCCCRCFHCSCG